LIKEHVQEDEMMHKKHSRFSTWLKCTGLIVTVLALITATAFSALADDISKYQQQLNAKKSDIAYYKKQIQKISDDINWRKHQREQIIKELEAVGMKKAEIEQKIQLIESAIDTLNEAIALTEAELAQKEELLKERLRAMYKSANVVWVLDELFRSSDWNELYIRVKMMNQLGKYDRLLINSVKNKRQELKELMELREYELQNCVEEAKRYAQEMQQLEMSRSSLEAAIQKDIKSKEEYERLEDILEKDIKETEELIRSLQSKSNLKFGGKMVWPMPTNKYIASQFGNRLHPIYKVWKMHTGLDIGSKLNEEIVAAADGVVIFAGTRSGYGNCVIIDHGSGITTLYAHINNRGILVRTGQTVKAGEVIAKAGQTGVATGQHLHFEVRVNGTPQNPLEYVKP